MVYIREIVKNGVVYNSLEHSFKVEGVVRKVTKSLGTGKLSEAEKKELIKKYDPWVKEQVILKKFGEIGRQYQLIALNLTEIGYLEYIRATYNEWLKDFLPSEFSNFEDNYYTKYIFNTASIEGNTLTLEETNLLLNEGVTPDGKELREIYEITNYKKVLKYVNNHKGDITLNFILKIHKLLLSNINEDIAGMLKRVDNYILGVDFQTTPAVIIKEELNSLIRWYNKQKRLLYPFELACLFHQKFVELHPFTDGNGRVGRELFRFILKKNSFPPIFFKVAKRKQYLFALKEGNSGNFKPLMQLAVEEFDTDFKGVFENMDNWEKIKEQYHDVFKVEERQKKLNEYSK